MHPAEIKARLAVRGFSLKKIAELCKVAQPTVSCVIKGTTTSRRIAQGISAASGVSLSDLFPGKYVDDARGRASLSRGVRK